MFTRLIDELSRVIRNYGDVLLVVEGKLDKEVMAKLGFSNIADISGTSLDAFAERLKDSGTKSVIILTDFDNDGISKASYLTKFFQKHHIKVLSSVRQKIRSLFKIHKVEEIVHFTRLLDSYNISTFTQLTNFTNLTSIMEDDSHRKVSSINDKIFNRSRIHSRRHNRETRRHRGNIRPD